MRDTCVSYMECDKPIESITLLWQVLIFADPFRYVCQVGEKQLHIIRRGKLLKHDTCKVSRMKL